MATYIIGLDRIAAAASIRATVPAKITRVVVSAKSRVSVQTSSALSAAEETLVVNAINALANSILDIR